MPRTNPELVAAIIDVDEDDTLDPYIVSANELVTELCTGSGYSDVRLELIERWLAAHFYDINRPRSAMESPGDGVQQQGEIIKVDLGLNLTKYGQQAMRMDTAGNLAGLENAIVNIKLPPAGSVSTFWLGTSKENWPNQ